MNACLTDFFLLWSTGWWGFKRSKLCEGGPEERFWPCPVWVPEQLLVVRFRSWITGWGELPKSDNQLLAGLKPPLFLFILTRAHSSQGSHPVCHFETNELRHSRELVWYLNLGPLAIHNRIKLYCKFITYSALYFFIQHWTKTQQNQNNFRVKILHLEIFVIPTLVDIFYAVYIEIKDFSLLNFALGS